MSETGSAYDYVCLIGGSSDGGEILYGAYLIAGDENVETLMSDLTSWGYSVTWEDAEPTSAEQTAPQAYTLHIIDQKGDPVPGVMVNFCTDTTCAMTQSDESGTITFEGAPDVYHVQLLKAPEGYSFDSDFDLYTDSVYGEWVLRIRED